MVPLWSGTPDYALRGPISWNRPLDNRRAEIKAEIEALLAESKEQPVRRVKRKGKVPEIVVPSIDPVDYSGFGERLGVLRRQLAEVERKIARRDAEEVAITMLMS